MNHPLVQEGMEPGYQIQQYVFVEKLGEGGMAEVWKATDTHLDDPVAVKFLLPHIARVADLQERFRNEGKRQAQLKHKNIVRVRQYLEHEGQFFLVMDFLEGGGLDRRMDEHPGPMSLDDTMRIALPVLSALGLAHSKQVIHRDISPQNVLFDQSGAPHLTDFGIALAVGHQRVTRTGTVMGKPHYMSPEQIKSPLSIDHRSDIYSFGVMLYEMLTGVVPFDAEDGDIEFQVKAMHLGDKPRSLRQLNPKIPESIDAVVLCALEKDPDRRPATCQALADALVIAETGVMPELPNRIEAGPSIDPEPSPDPQPKPAPEPLPHPVPMPPVPPDPKPALWKWGAAAALLAGCLAAGVWYFTRKPEAPVTVVKTNLVAKPDDGGKEAVSDLGKTKQELNVKKEDSSAKVTPAIKSDGQVKKETARVVEPPRPVVSLAAEPAKVPFNGSSVVRWDVRNASRVFLDGRPVADRGEAARSNLLFTTTLVLRVVDASGKSSEQPVTIHVASIGETAVDACTSHGLSPNLCRKNWNDCRAAGISERGCYERLK